jgi:excisionase family DNA binding protein
MISDPPSTPGKWLTLVEAAELLHVHPSTLRRWANNGDIPVMITPGGHRRFSEEDVTRFADTRRSIYKPGRLERMWVNQALAETRKAISTTPAGQSWLERFDEESRRRHRILGQRLMGLLLEYLAARGDRKALLEEARKIGQDYALGAHAVGLGVSEALRASMFFRDTLIGATHRMPDNLRIRPEAKMRLLHRINTLLNTVQLAIVEIYDAEKTDRMSGS